MKILPGTPRKDRNKTPARRTESRSPQLPGLRMGLLLFLFLMAAAAVLAPIAAQGSGAVSVSAARNDDGASADVSWTAYDGDDFSYYRVIVCDDSQYDGASCSGAVYRSDAIYEVKTTGPVTAAGLDPHAGYGVILQVWDAAESSATKIHAYIPALPQPTPTPTPEPTEEPTSEPTEEPTPEPTEEPAAASAAASDEVSIQATLSFTPSSFSRTFYKGLSIGTVTLPYASGADSYSFITRPAGLSFNGSNRQLTGTPTEVKAATNYFYHAEDTTYGDSGSMNISIEVKNSITFGSNTIDDQTYNQNTAITSLTLPAVEKAASSADLTGVSYSISPSLPAGLSFNSSTRVISGAPTASAAQTTYTYTASHSSYDSETLTFDITVTTPVVRFAVFDSDHYFYATQDIGTLQLPTASGDTGITYKLTSQNPPIRGDYPDGVTYNSTNRTFTGTPTDLSLTKYWEYDYEAIGTTTGRTDAKISFKIWIQVSTCLSREPTNLAAWRLVSFNGSAPIYQLGYDFKKGTVHASNYYLRYRESGGSWTEVTPSHANLHLRGVITNLKEDTSYDLQAGAEHTTLHSVCQRVWTSTLTMKTGKSGKPDKPAAPTVAQASTNPETSLTATWTAPFAVPQVSDYDVQYKKKNDSTYTSWSHTGTALTATITGLDVNTDYHVQVQATNSSGDSAWSDNGSGKTDDNDAPAFSANTATRSVAENSAAASNVGAALAATDPESDTLTYSLTGTDAGKFDIGATTGQIAVKTGNIPDYEAKTSYSVTVGVSDKKDADGKADTVVDDTIAVTINVTDVNEPPPKMDPSAAQQSSNPKYEIAVSWQTPTMTGKPALSHYDLRYRKKGVSTWTQKDDLGKALKYYAITGLTYKTTYEVEMRGANDEGDGAWSDTDEVKTHDQTEPEFSDDSVTLSIAEDAAVGDDVGKVVATDDDKDTLYYSLSGSGADKFSVGQYNGTIDVAKALDYEATSSYTLTMSVKDKKASDDTADNVVDDTITVTINVTDVNEPPAKPSAPTVAVNATTPSSKLDVSWTAPDMTGKPAITDYDVQYRKKGDSTWTDANFTGTTASATLTGLTSGKTYEAQVRATNHEGTSGWSDSGTAITDASAVTRSVAENSAAGTNIGAAVTAKANSEYTYTHSLDGTDKDKFTIESGSGQIKVKSGNIPDYEAKTSYSVTVVVAVAEKNAGVNAQSLDPNAPGSYKIPVTINVTDVNEPPAKPAAPTVTAHATEPKYKLEVSWAAPDMTGKPAVTDYDVQYKKSSDSTWTSHSFTGTGTSATLTGLTAGTTYDVQVKAVNDEGNSGWSASGSKKTKANAAPEIPATATRSIAENSAANAAIGAVVSATDADSDTLTYSLDGTDKDKFAIDSATGQIKVKDALDYEAKTSYTVEVDVTDGKDSHEGTDNAVDDTATVTINVTDADEPPAKLDAPTVTQNAATPKTKLDVSWTAPDMTGKPAVTDYDVQYRKKGAADWTDASFTGTETTTTLTGLTEGTEYDVQVKAKNDEGNSGWSDSGKANTQDKNVHSDFPDETATRSVAENSAAGTNVGAAVTAIDTEGHTLYYSLNGTDKDKFDIGLNTGQIAVKSGNVPDYEAKTSYSVKVEVSDRKDSDNNADTKIDDTIEVTINVTDVDEPPAAPAAPTVAQNTETPKTKLDVSWTAPDMTGKPAISGYDVQYKKSADSTWTSHSFTGTGTATTLTGLTEGVEYEVQVKAKNDEGKSAWSDSGKAKTEDKNVNPQFPEIPDDGTSLARSVAENSAAGTNVGAPVTAADTEGDALTYSLSGTDAASFDIVSSSGQIQVKAALDYESKSSYSVTVNVSDKKDSDDNADTEIDDTIAVTISVTDVNDAPKFPGDKAKRSVAENSAADTKVGDPVTASDDDGDTLTYSLSGTDTDKFAIDSATGRITVKSGAVLDFESLPPYYTFTAEVSDGKDSEGNADTVIDHTMTVEVHITDVAEPLAAPAKPGVAQNHAAPRNKLDVSWTAPDMTGKPPVTGYAMLYRKSGDSAWTSHALTGTGTTVTLAGLTAGTSYQVKVQAANAEGSSDWSVPGTGTTKAAGTPTIVPGSPGTPLTPTPSAPPAADDAEPERETVSLEEDDSWLPSRSSVAPAAPEPETHGGGARLLTREGIAFVVAENSPAGAAVGIPVGAEDPDDDAIVWTINGDREFAIDAATGQIEVAPGAGLDYESRRIYTLTISVSDGLDGNGSLDMAPDDSASVTVLVADEDEPPAQPEAPAVSPDPDAPIAGLTVKWTAPANEGRPDIAGYDLRYRALDAPGWTGHPVDETATAAIIGGLEDGAAYEAQVRAVNEEGAGPWSDAGQGATQKANGVPSFPPAAVLQVAENSPAGTPVGEPIAAADPENGPLTYAISGADEFAIDESTGRIRVAPGAALDYETARSYTVTVSVSDGLDAIGRPDGSTDASVAVAILVTDVAEGGLSVAHPGDKAYQQGQAIQPFAIEVSGGPSAVSLGGLPNGLFYDGKTVSGAVHHDAAPGEYPVTVTAIEAGGAAAQTFMVTVRLNAAPEINVPDDRSYVQGQSIAPFRIAASDAEDAVTAQVSGLPQGLVHAGELVSGRVAADAETRTYRVTITADDGINPAVSAHFAITVETPNAPPSLTVPGDRAYAQGETIGDFAILATDPDAGDTVTVTVTGLPRGLTYDGGLVSGMVSEEAPLGAYEVTVTASDGLNDGATAQFTVTVTEAGGVCVSLPTWLLGLGGLALLSLAIAYVRERMKRRAAQTPAF